MYIWHVIRSPSYHLPLFQSVISSGSETVLDVVKFKQFGIELSPDLKFYF